jgi:hypothetical protein
MMAYAQLFGRASKEVLFLLYAKPLRIHVFFLLFYVLCLGVIAGCAENDTANKTDYFNSGESTSDIEGIALDNGAVELYLDVDSDKIQVINDFLKTNTKRIVVTSSEIDESVEIELFLYAYENANEPIAYATLSGNTATATFSNLTSAMSYKVGGKINNGTTPTTLTISD